MTVVRFPGRAPAPSSPPQRRATDRLAPPSLETEALEIRLLVEAVYQRFGVDFREYALSSLRRRIRQCMLDEGVPTVSELQSLVLHERGAVDRLVTAVSVSVTSMFRDPEFFQALRRHAVPALRKEPFLRIWHVGCATGEEVYSTAILLREEGLLHRCRIYATDMDDLAVQKAREGVYPLDRMRENTSNYLRAGGRGDFSAYYTVRGGRVLFDPLLRSNVVFAHHNLVTDSSFNEFHLVLCRNVLIYFTAPLRDRVHHVLYESLSRRGMLGLGNRETVDFTPFAGRYEPLEAKLYRRRA